MNKTPDSYQKWATEENRTKLEETRKYLARISGRPYVPIKVVESMRAKKEPKQEFEHKRKRKKKSQQKSKQRSNTKPIPSKRSRAKKQKRLWSDGAKPLINYEGEDMYNLAGEYEARNVDFGHGRRKSDEWNDRSAFDLKDKLKEEREAREKGWV